MRLNARSMACGLTKRIRRPERDNENHDSRRLLRYAPDVAMLPEACRPFSDRLERSSARDGSTYQAHRRCRGACAHPGADQDHSPTPRAATEPQADKPAERLS